MDYEFINKEPVDYQGLYSIFHMLDSDDVSLILKYDKQEILFNSLSRYYYKFDNN
jgi:hypothetical protein